MPSIVETMSNSLYKDGPCMRKPHAGIDVDFRLFKMVVPTIEAPGLAQHLQKGRRIENIFKRVLAMTVKW